MVNEFKKCFDRKRDKSNTATQTPASFDHINRGFIIPLSEEWNKRLLYLSTSRYQSRGLVNIQQLFALELVVSYCSALLRNVISTPKTNMHVIMVGVDWCNDTTKGYILSVCFSFGLFLFMLKVILTHFRASLYK